ncbi:aspartate-semialdehyde dehydrogenase [Pseudomonas fulva]|nr:aspartate-semialdehyde dehydrogenase [Pseudomonas fulva]MBF8781521.1 aspartate-semialdehyde dehydrogenase [Pseudomonas fulva]
MLPPVIPLSAAPVTSQLDQPRPTPSVAPVAPIQSSSGGATIDLRNQRDPAEHALLLREEQRRRHQRQQDQAERYSAVPGETLNADNTVPVEPLIGERTRQGLLIDIEV